MLAQAAAAPQPRHDPSEIPPALLERLRAEGVNSLADWREFGKRRFHVWGITRRMVRELDELARGAR